MLGTVLLTLPLSVLYESYKQNVENNIILLFQSTTIFQNVLSFLFQNYSSFSIYRSSTYSTLLLPFDGIQL